MKQKHSKINSIEALRFIFMSILVSHHAGFNFTKHGYLVVEFFFMLSGYLLYNSFKKHGKSTIDYTIGKLKRTYIEYAIACIITFFLFGIGTNIIHGTISLETILKILPELLLMQNIGIFEGGFNAPLWYYSVLIWGGGGIYLLLNMNENIVVKIIIPITILTTYTYIFQKSDNIELWGGCIPLLRGVSGMGLGILVYHIRERFKINNIYCNLFGCISFILYIIIIFMVPNLDRYSLILIPFILINTFNEDGIFNMVFKSSIWQFLGSITFEMYVLHSLFIFFLYKTTNYMNIVIEHNILIFMIFLIVLCSFSFLFKQYCKRINIFIK